MCTRAREMASRISSRRRVTECSDMRGTQSQSITTLVMYSQLSVAVRWPGENGQNRTVNCRQARGVGRETWWRCVRVCHLVEDAAGHAVRVAVEAGVQWPQRQREDGGGRGTERVPHHHQLVVRAGVRPGTGIGTGTGVRRLPLGVDGAGDRGARSEPSFHRTRLLRARVCPAAMAMRGVAEYPLQHLAMCGRGAGEV